METQKLIPFDLEKALAGEKVITRDGRPVKIAGYNPNCHEAYRLAVWLDNDTVKGFYANGKYTEAESGYDLFMAPKPRIKKEGWVNLYPSGANGKAKCSFYVYGSEKEAIEDSHNSKIATAKVEWEEEQ